LKEQAKAAAEHAGKMMAGLGGFVLGGGGKGINAAVDTAKEIITRGHSQSSTGGYGGDLAGLSGSGGIKQVVLDIAKSV
jgi:hypothetical protein